MRPNRAKRLAKPKAAACPSHQETQFEAQVAHEGQFARRAAGRRERPAITHDAGFEKETFARTLAEQAQQQRTCETYTYTGHSIDDLLTEPDAHDEDVPLGYRASNSLQ